MAITISNYLANFSFPSVPRINIDINNTTQENLNNVVSAYNVNSEKYANSYIEAFNNKNYIVSMFEKDACADAGLATIDKVNNTYTASIKADNYYNQANKNNANFTYESQITEVYNNLIELKNNLFDDEENSSDTEGEWTVTKTLSPIVYDTQAITVSTSVLTEETANVVFIKDVAKNINDARTFTAFQSNGSYDPEDSSSSESEFITKYTISKNGDVWQIKDTENEVVKVSEDIDAETIVWTNPITE